MADRLADRREIHLLALRVALRDPRLGKAIRREGQARILLHLSIFKIHASETMQVDQPLPGAVPEALKQALDAKIAHPLHQVGDEMAEAAPPNSIRVQAPPMALPVVFAQRAPPSVQ
ncbi:MAG: hypothetical protein HYZ53_04940 [Planctomycetes bacterium]|nr:hypothetical protein [Planctomycetota bacterium]